ncbi:MAG: hypothetical protein IJ751_06410, partial [Oscillospiraceae bacterium]|nr:hypothetical protein [Oscillospiraceae bacterium]
DHVGGDAPALSVEHMRGIFLHVVDEAEGRVDGAGLIKQQANAQIQEELAQTAFQINVKAILRSAVLCAILLAVLAAVVFALREVFRDTLQNELEVECRYGIPMLGSTYRPFPADKMSAHKGLDRLLDRWEGYSESLDAPLQYELAAAKLCRLTGGERRLLISGPVSEAQLQAVYEGIKPYLPPDFSLVMARNPMEQPEAMRETADAEILLIAGINDTRVRELDRLVSFLRLSKTRVLGAFIV